MVCPEPRQTSLLQFPKKPREVSKGPVVIAKPIYFQPRFSDKSNVSVMALTNLTNTPGKP